MELRNKQTGAVITESEFRELFKHEGAKGNISTEYYTDRGYDIVFEGPQASGGTVYQFSMRQGVEQQSDGKWYTKYVLGPIFTDVVDEDGKIITAAQQEAEYKARKDAEQAKAVRTQRNETLTQSDWVVIKALELGEEIPADWASYRQALRDIPTQAGFPWNIVWPVQPE
jgi:hypothetical protein